VDTGADIAAAQTQPLPGPGGVSVALKVSSADDHSKDSHDCMADYHLLITPAGGGTPVDVDFYASDADYGRIISLRLDGFSQDGKRVFGILSETGKYPSTMLFDYDSAGGPVQLIDLKKPFARIVPAKCSVTFDVIGTTDTGATVFETNSADKCAPNSRWVVDHKSQKPQPLPQAASIRSLYR
jgi:hypothetical protein